MPAASGPNRGLVEANAAWVSATQKDQSPLALPGMLLGKLFLAVVVSVIRHAAAFEACVPSPQVKSTVASGSSSVFAWMPVAGPPSI